MNSLLNIITPLFNMILHTFNIPQDYSILVITCTAELRSHLRCPIQWGYIPDALSARKFYSSYVQVWASTQIYHFINVSEVCVAS